MGMTLLFPEYGITEHEKEMFDMLAGREDELTSVTAPDKARRYLESLGYAQDIWETIVKEKIGSHDLRTFAIIALGNTPRFHYTVYSNLRVLDHFDGWPPLRNDMGIEPTLRQPDMHTEAVRQAILRACE